MLPHGFFHIGKFVKFSKNTSTATRKFLPICKNENHLQQQVSKFKTFGCFFSLSPPEKHIFMLKFHPRNAKTFDTFPRLLKLFQPGVYSENEPDRIQEDGKKRKNEKN